MISQQIQVGQVLYSYSYNGNTFVIKKHVVNNIVNYMERELIIINDLRNRYDASTLRLEHYSHDSPKRLYRSEQEIKDEQEYRELFRNIQDTIESGGCLNLDKARRINSILLEN